MGGYGYEKRYGIYKNCDCTVCAVDYVFNVSLMGNSIALKEGIRVTTDALHMEMKQKLNSILTYKGTTCVHVEGDTADLENTYLDMKVTAYDTQTKQDVSDTLDTKIYDTGMQLKGAHPIVIIMQGDADRLNDREIMIQLTAQLEQANF